MSSLDKYTKSRFAQPCFLMGDIVNWYDCKEISTIEFQQQNQVKGKGKKVDEPRLIVVCHFLHRPPVLIARLYLTHQDKYLHQGGCPALARWRECRRALLGRPGLLARRVGRRKGYRFHLQGLIGGMKGLWVLVRVIRSLYVLV